MVVIIVNGLFKPANRTFDGRNVCCQLVSGKSGMAAEPESESCNSETASDDHTA